MHVIVKAGFTDFLWADRGTEEWAVNTTLTYGFEFKIL